MSRVEEALRKAAAQAALIGGEAVRESAVTDEVVSLDPETLAREPYPLEMQERRPSSQRRTAIAPNRAAVPEIAPRAEPREPRETGPLLQRMDESLAEKVVVDHNIDAGAREQYRRLAAALHHAQASNGLKVVLITSAVQSEGKSLTATNLALTLSESYHKNVILIDADLRQPTLHSTFRVDNSAGLSEGLTSRERRRLPVRSLSSRLAILPAGHPTPDPMGAITSERMRQITEEARDAFDWVIVDSPPVALVPDANLLASMADAVVIVVKAETTSYELVNRALAAIGRERVIGIVLNRSHGGLGSDGYSYYAYANPDELSEP